MKNILRNFFIKEKINHYIMSVTINDESKYTFSVSVTIDNINKPIMPRVFAKYVKQQLLEEFSVKVKENEIHFDFISMTGKNY